MPISEVEGAAHRDIIVEVLGQHQPIREAFNQAIVEVPIRQVVVAHIQVLD